MLSGSLLPLSSDLPLSRLLARARAPEDLGAWIRGVAVLRIYRVARGPSGRVLASSDLGFLLGRCSRIAAREGKHLTVLAAETVIQWRALQVATATPYLPALERLLPAFPGLRAIASGLLVPIGRQSPEEVLAHCLAEGVRVVGSRIVYARHHPVDAATPEGLR